MTTPSRLAVGILGVDRNLRARTTQTLLAFLIYLIFAALQQYGVNHGYIGQQEATALNCVNLVGGLCFYFAVRLDSKSLWASSTNLTALQQLYALACISAAYAFAGEVRAAPLVLFPLIVPFGGVALSPGQLRSISTTGLCMLMAVMAWRSITLPELYATPIEILHAIAACTVTSAATSLTIRFGRMRKRLIGQREELATALARNRALASMDELTGLINRRVALERLHNELAVRGRGESCTSVALIDIDHFKRINDSYGHAAGDKVLRRFAQTAQNAARIGDVVARWGGEEFLIVLPATIAAHALASLNRLHNEMAALSFEDIAPGLVITFSAGVADCGELEDIDAAIDRADRAMYLAKQGGRNRSMLAK